MHSYLTLPGDWLSEFEGITAAEKLAQYLVKLLELFFSNACVAVKKGWS